MTCEGEVFLVNAVGYEGVKRVEVLGVQMLSLVNVLVLGKKLQEEAIWQETLR
jgi:hypothetical protein